MQGAAPNTQNRATPPAGQAAPPRATQAHARYARLIHDLRPGERLMLLQRRHASVLLARLLWPLALSLAWLASLFFVPTLLAGLQPDPILNPDGIALPAWVPTALWFAWLGILAVVALWAAYVVLDWSDHWIALTTRRVIVMDKTLFFRETRREAPLAMVQNVIAEYPNAFALSLDFGHLKVDTAGVGLLPFNDLPRPKVMREAIFAQQALIRSNQPAPEELRKASIERIVLGADPNDPLRHERPTPPSGNAPPPRPGLQPAAPSPVTQIGTFHRLFPFSPHRQGDAVTWHKHWYFLLRGVAWPLLIYAAALAGWAVAIALGEPGMVGPIESIVGWIAVALTPVCLTWAVWNWEDWRNDKYRLDRERVYHVESLPFGLREQSKETLITRITDVTYIVPSPLANLLNFGDVVIKTPGEATEFIFRRIPRPREVQQEIMARVDEHRLKDSANTDREIEAWLKAYHEARNVMRET